MLATLRSDQQNPVYLLKSTEIFRSLLKQAPTLVLGEGCQVTKHLAFRHSLSKNLIFFLFVQHLKHKE